MSYPINQRSIFLSKLHQLTNYRFAGYISHIHENVHLVRLCVMDFERQGFHSSVCYVDFIVTEHTTHFSAVSKCGRIVVERLS